MARVITTFALLAACGQSQDSGTPVALDGGDEGARRMLHLWYTCGDPVCRGASHDPSLPFCGTRAAGDPCREAGFECDIKGDDCNRTLVCAATDPTGGPGGCPISKRMYKSDIRYLSAQQTDAVRDELLAMPLATWEYTAEGAGANTHLGFVIDDVPASPAVSEGGDTVDLYGYTSMAIAALQAQQREIDTLRAEVETLKAALRH
jgi:hypothetical protein